ncbi:GDSL-type esterase/lipase family protein [Chakrabartyella piscis]|uniref:GDSL-type esterase/lipase family protein n=1 Tax=Chakrabartyella piscis TaxID=2918914 RepID=UPI0029585F2F|nr:GDSL-type esterase/lipase family protein [Chakrabartyella piscis]
MKIVCLGDSITRSFGVKPSCGWLNLVNSQLDCTIINYAIAGDTTNGMLIKFHTQVLKDHPDVLFIMGGGNDLRAGAPATALQTNIVSLVYNARANGIFPIIGLTVPEDHKNLSPEFRKIPVPENIEIEREQYRNWLIEYCKALNVPTIDFYHIFDGKDLKDVYIDGLHPTTESQKLIADEFLRRFKEILN